MPASPLTSATTGRPAAISRRIRGVPSFDALSMKMCCQDNAIREGSQRAGLDRGHGFTAAHRLGGGLDHQVELAGDRSFIR